MQVSAILQQGKFVKTLDIVTPFARITDNIRPRQALLFMHSSVTLCSVELPSKVRSFK